MELTKPFIVAEISSNHRGSYDTLLKTIDAAAKAGADAVKFQTYTPSEIAVDLAIPDGPWAGCSYHDLYREAMMPWAWHEGAFRHARELGLVPFSTPFSLEAVDRLESLGCEIYKIASFEITWLELIKKAASTGKPLIISTGMATQAEIVDAWLASRGVIFLHCISAYPAIPRDFHLKNLKWYKEHGFQFGLSDHCISNTASVAAIAMGAMVIEKHFTLSRAECGGPDAKFSLEPKEFERLVIDCHDAFYALGDEHFGPSEIEETSMQYRRSVWLVEPIKAGDVLTANHLAVLRPNHGLPPAEYSELIGKTVNRDLPAKTPMSWEFIE